MLEVKALVRMCICTKASFKCIFKSSGTRGLILGLSLTLLLYFVYVISEGSGETVHMY